MTVDDILEALPDLTADELSRVQAAMKLLGAADPIDEPSDLLCRFYSQLKKQMARRHLDIPHTVQRCLSKVQLAIAEEGAGIATAWLFKNLNPQTVQEEHATVTLAIEVLWEWYEARKTMPSSRTLMLGLANVPLAIEASFPGYAQNNALRFVMNRMRDSDD